MSIKFFGQFLLERNVINTEQLLEAVSYQENRNLKFGQYAQGKGFLNAADVERLNEEQKTTDLRIGELAVKLGMLDSTQVEEILTMQKNDHVQIGQVLIKKGFIDEKGLMAELAAFKEDQSAYATGQVNVPTGVKDPELINEIVDLTLKMLQRVVKVEAKANDGAVLESEPPEAYSAISITLSGGLNCDYVIFGDEGASRAMAASILGSDATDEDREMVVDGVKEFANTVCGNLLGKMAQHGKSVEISVPHILTYSGGYGLLNNGRKPLAYDMLTTAGKIILVIIAY